MLDSYIWNKPVIAEQRFEPDMGAPETDNWPIPWVAFLLEADNDLREAYFEQVS